MPFTFIMPKILKNNRVTKTKIHYRMAEKGNFKIYSLLYVEIKHYTIFVGFYSHEHLKKVFFFHI